MNIALVLERGAVGNGSWERRPVEMCTVTVIPARVGPRLVSSRDEKRARPPGLPPRVVEAEGGVRALWPTDSLAGGTWIGATERRLILAILNGNPSDAGPGSAPAVSRGSIIPALAGSRSAPEALERLGWMPLECFAPFRLVAVDGATITHGMWDRRSLLVERRALGPLCFVSSGLGDELVRPRLELFERWIAERGVSARAQDEFHSHRWPGRPEISVRMSREDARTVSVTSVELGAGGSARMVYRDDDGEREAWLSQGLGSRAGAAR